MTVGPPFGARVRVSLVAVLAACGGDGPRVSDAYVDLGYTHSTPLNAERWAIGQPVVFYFVAGNKGPDPMPSARLAVRLGPGLQMLRFACIPDPVGRAACPAAVDTASASATGTLSNVEAGGFVMLVVSTMPAGSTPFASDATLTIETDSDDDTSNNAVAWSVRVE